MKIHHLLLLCWLPLLAVGEDRAVIADDQALLTAWDAPKDVLKERYAQMLGLVLLDGTRTMYILNKKTAIVVADGGVQEVWVGDCIFDWNLAGEIDNVGCVIGTAHITPGISLGMEYDAVKQVFGDSLGAADYRVKARHGDLVYEMQFSSTTMGGESKKVFTLRAVRVKREVQENGNARSVFDEM